MAEPRSNAALVSTVLITGANRGIGLGLARQFAGRGWHVLAACRSPEKAEELLALARTSSQRVDILRLDVGDAASLDAWRDEVNKRLTRLDVLVNNAGVHPGVRTEKMGAIDLAAIEAALAINALAPIAVTQALLPLLRTGRNPRVVNISSGAGSMKAVATHVHYGYAMSKAALNMFVRRSALDLGPEGVTSVAISPGWIRTDMGGADAEVALDEGTAALAATIEALTPAQNGQWLDRFGRVSDFAW